MMFRRIFKIVLIVAVFGSIGIQFIRPERISPPIVRSEDLFASGSVPLDVQAIMTRSCNDCHTNQTNYPWYSNVAPVSWWLADHVQHGRQHLNFNAWNTYGERKKLNRLEDICSVIQADTMPLPSYLWAHRDAVLTGNDKAVLCGWTRTATERLIGSDR